MGPPDAKSANVVLATLHPPSFGGRFVSFVNLTQSPCADDLVAVAHYIRLRGPWEIDRSGISRFGSTPFESAESITLPTGWQTLSERDWARPLRLRRRFGRPTSVTDSERVDLVITNAAEGIEVLLNGQALSATRSADLQWRADVTRLLAARNELLIVVRQAFDEARLEITAESG